MGLVLWQLREFRPAGFFLALNEFTVWEDLMSHFTMWKKDLSNLRRPLHRQPPEPNTRGRAGVQTPPQYCDLSHRTVCVCVWHSGSCPDIIIHLKYCINASLLISSPFFFLKLFVWNYLPFCILILYIMNVLIKCFVRMLSAVLFKARCVCVSTDDIMVWLFNLFRPVVTSCSHLHYSSESDLNTLLCQKA